MNLQLPQLGVSKEESAKIADLFAPYAPLSHDPWGASRDTLLKVAPFVNFLYEKYFRVSAVGLDEVPEGPAIFIANHGGQIPIDGLMVVYALLAKAQKNRLTRAMVERWVPTLPFIGSFFMKLGQIVGEQKNCLQLLKNKQSVLVFPEGVKGSGKTIEHRYQLQAFPSGFYRLAIEAQVPIIPVVLVGTEESYPAIANFKPLAKLLRAPYFPITPSFPLLGPLGLVPVPSKISMKFLPAIYPELTKEASDKEVFAEVEKIKKSMQAAIKKGLKKRGSNILQGEAFSDS
ncbi:MAG: lysophospholipid acyltransferase family protein [Bdellovibrionota bacterium]